MNIIEELKNDILTGDEVQYNYEIDGVGVTILMDYGDEEIQILASDYNGHSFDCIIGEDFCTVDEAVDMLVSFIIKNTL